MHDNYSLILYLILLKVEWNSLTQIRLLPTVLLNDTLVLLLSILLVKIILDTVWTEERIARESLKRKIFITELALTLNVILSPIKTEKFRGTWLVGLFLSLAAVNAFLWRLEIW